MLVSAFTRALSDPFPPARKAGLTALTASLDSFDLEDICTRVLPSICTQLMDPTKDIRTQALVLLEALTKRIQHLQSLLPEDALLVKEKVNPATPSTGFLSSFAKFTTSEPATVKATSLPAQAAVQSIPNSNSLPSFTAPTSQPHTTQSGWDDDFDLDSPAKEISLLPAKGMVLTKESTGWDNNNWDEF